MVSKLSPREQFRADAVETLTQWRLGCIPPRPDDRVVHIFHEGIKDLVRLRLTLAYMPLFVTLERLQHRMGVLTDLKREPWAHPNDSVNRRRSGVRSPRSPRE